MVVAGKSTSDAANLKPFPPDPNSPSSTVSTVVREIRENGGEATAVRVDVRDFDDIQKMVARTVEVRDSGPSGGMAYETAGIRPSGRARLQLWRHLVGRNRGDTHEALPAHAARQSRRPLRHRTSLSASVPASGMERPHHCRLTANLQPLLPRQGQCARLTAVWSCASAKPVRTRPPMRWVRLACPSLRSGYLWIGYARSESEWQ